MIAKRKTRDYFLNLLIITATVVCLIYGVIALLSSLYNEVMDLLLKSKG